jgi:hypothetical protein
VDNELVDDDLLREGAHDPDPVIEAFKKDVDRTLLRENLKLTFEQRFENLREMARLREELREAGRRVFR